ncbi:MAG: extracellular solute-binding protein [Proteobacteria bacterium]|nr:extracellular solute-binding protein [Pseudomonadota bacterium]
MSKTIMTRRQALATTAAGIGLLAAPAIAQERTLTILSHKVHENVARGAVAGTTGGDIAGEWAAQNGVKLNWITADIDPIHDRLQRELALRQSSIDVALIINKYATPRLSRLLEPLDPWQQRAGIAEFGGIPSKLLDAVRIDGNLFAVPYRHATTGMHYNEALLAERGLSGAPTSIEQFIDYARKLTFTRSDGTKVNGLSVPAGAGPFAVLSLLSAFGAEIYDANLNVKADGPGMVEGLKTMNQLFREGVLPSNYATLSIDEVITSMQLGQSAMSCDPFARFTSHNDPRRSKYPGQIKVAPIPAKGGGFVAMTEIWAFAVPKNAQQKELSWSFVRELSSPANTIRAALNGNGPVRPAAYSDSRLQQNLPYTKEEAIAIANAATLPSTFDASAQASTVFMEESQAAVIGLKTPERAAADMRRRVEALIKR